MTDEMKVRNDLSQVEQFIDELDFEVMSMKSIIRCAFALAEGGCLGEVCTDVENVLLYIDSRLAELQNKYCSIQCTATAE